MAVATISPTTIETFNGLVEKIEKDTSRSKKGLRDLLAADQRGFFACALPHLLADEPTYAGNYLYELLTGLNLLPFCDPSLTELEQDVRIARKVMEREPKLDVKLAQRIATSGEAAARRPDCAMRLLAVLEQVGEGSRVLPTLVKVLRHPNSKLRSKAALMVGRTNKSPQWVEQALMEPDPRVRANAVESLWGLDIEAARTVLWAASRDTHHRVAANALYGLYLLGEPACIPGMLQMAADKLPLFRAAGTWVMGKTGDPRFMPLLARMVRESDPVARHSVFRAIASLKRAAKSHAESAPLRLYLYSSLEAPDSARSVRAAIGLNDGEPLPDLRPTSVVIWEGTTLVTDYSVRRLRKTDLLSVAIVIPAARTCPSSHGEALADIVAGAVTDKRPTDRWAILRFGNVIQEADETRHIPFDSNVLPPCQLSLDTTALTTSLNDPGNRSGYVEAVQAAINALAEAPGSRNVIIMEDRTQDSKLPDIAPARWMLFLKDAEAAGVAFNAMVLTSPGREPGALREVCQQSGGVYLETTDLDRVRSNVEKIRFGIAHPYTIRYKPVDPASTEPLKVQIFAPEGSAEEPLQNP